MHVERIQCHFNWVSRGFAYPIGILNNILQSVTPFLGTKYTSFSDKGSDLILDEKVYTYMKFFTENNKQLDIFLKENTIWLNEFYKFQQFTLFAPLE